MLKIICEPASLPIEIGTVWLAEVYVLNFGCSGKEENYGRDRSSRYIKILIQEAYQ